MAKPGNDAEDGNITNNHRCLLQASSFAEGLKEIFPVRLTTVPSGRCSSCPPVIDEESGARKSRETCPSHLAGK